MKKLFSTIEIEGFRSIVKPFTFNLHRIGLTLLKGHNGAGKTTLFEALVWVLFGINLKDTLSEQVVTWPEARGAAFRGTRVILDFKSDASDYKIARHIGYKGDTEGLRGGDKLMIFKDGELIGEELNKKGMQEYINDLMGVSAKTFMNSILFGQRMAKLVETAGEDKRKLFEELFDVSWVDYLKARAENDRDRLQVEILMLDKERAESRVRMEGLQEKLRDDKRLLESFHQEIEECKEAAEMDIAEKEVKLEELLEDRESMREPEFSEEDLKIAQEEEAKVRQLSKDIALSLGHERAHMKSISDRYDKLVTKVEAQEDKVAGLKREYEYWKEQSPKVLRAVEEPDDVEFLKEVVDTHLPTLIKGRNETETRILTLTRDITGLQKKQELAQGLANIESEHCEYCGSELDKARAKQLQQHHTEELGKATAALFAAEEELEKLQETLPEINESIEAYEADAETYYTWQRYLDHLKQEEVNRMKGEMLQKQVKEADDLRVEIDEELQDLTKEFTTVRAKEKVLADEHLSAGKRWEDVHSVLEDRLRNRQAWHAHHVKASNLSDQIDKIKGEIKFIQKYKAELDARKPPAVDLQVTEATIKALSVTITGQIDTMREKGLEVDKAEWFIKHGRHIKSFIFKAMLGRLNELTAQYGARLGAAVRFSIDTSKASKPFITTCSIGDVKNKDYKELSGGQKSRIDIILTFAMHSLISEMVNVNVLLLDEIFENLDEHGEAQVFDLVREKAKETSVYVISHSATLDSLYTNTIDFELVDNQTQIAI